LANVDICTLAIVRVCGPTNPALLSELHRWRCRSRGRVSTDGALSHHGIVRLLAHVLRLAWTGVARIGSTNPAFLAQIIQGCRRRGRCRVLADGALSNHDIVRLCALILRLARTGVARIGSTSPAFFAKLVERVRSRGLAFVPIWICAGAGKCLAAGLRCPGAALVTSAPGSAVGAFDVSATSMRVSLLQQCCNACLAPIPARVCTGAWISLAAGISRPWAALVARTLGVAVIGTVD